MEYIKKTLLNKETLSYLFFGVLTTIVNYAVFLGTLVLYGDENALTANTISFIAATLFAYITNKIWVFKSKKWNVKVLKKEILSFSSARVISFLFEQVSLFICINMFGVGEYLVLGINGILVSKIILSFIVVIVNYGLSKFFIFK